MSTPPNPRIRPPDAVDQDPSAIVAVANLPRNGTVIEQTYRIVDELGRGSFGVVYAAEQLPLERRVALKMLKPQAVLLPGVQERFIREARLVSALQSRHTITVFGFGVYAPRPQLNGLPFIIMEHLQGEGLDSLLQRQSQLPPREALQITRQVLISLAEAHERGVIHRDIKPENIFLVEQDHERIVKVLDFGIARAVGGDWSEETRQRLTRTGIICGTPAFMAPEQATGAQDITPSADLYSVGCITFLLLTGRLPYPGYSPTAMAYGHLSDPIPPLPTPLDATPLAAVLRKAMAKSPGQRFRSAQEFIRELDDCIDANPEIFGPNAQPIDIEGAPSAETIRADTLQVAAPLLLPIGAPHAPPRTPPPPTADLPATLPPSPEPAAPPPTLIFQAPPHEPPSANTRRTAVIIQRPTWGGVLPALLIFGGGLLIAGVILFIGITRQQRDTEPAQATAPLPVTAEVSPDPPASAALPPPEPTSAPAPPASAAAPQPEAPHEEPAAPPEQPTARPRTEPAATRRAAPTSAAPVGPDKRGHLLITCAQPDLIVFIDGSGPYGCGRSISFPPGDYAVRAHARGQEIRRVVHLKQGAQQRIALSIE